MERLTKRTKSGVAYLAVADTLPKADQEIEGSKPILEGIYAMLQKTAEYEDLEEQGLLIKLPCKVGDTVYIIDNCGQVLMHHDNDYINGTGAVECPYESDCEFEECNDNHKRVFKSIVEQYFLEEDGNIVPFFSNFLACKSMFDFGKTVFLTKEEAEKALESDKE